MQPSRLTWVVFAVGAVVTIAVVFSLTRILEETLLREASLQTLKHLYISRGALASFLVMALAILVLDAQHRRSEAALAKLSRAVENSPVSIIITNRKGDVEYVNPRFSQMTGYSGAEMLGQNPRLLKSGRTPPEIYKQLWDAITAGKDWQGEVINRRKDGQVYDELLRISPIRNSKGEITHYVGVMEDVTEKKKIDRLKDELVGTISHEIRTPLAIIRLSIENLKDELAGSLKEEHLETLEGVLRNCIRLAKISGEMLDFSRLESGQPAIGPERAILLPVLEETRKNYEKPARERGLRLDIQVPDGLPDLNADPSRLIQVFRNLFDNALRYARSRIGVTVTPFDGFLHLIVEDDGPGIAPEELDRLFYRYHRIRATQSRGETGGAGLGLAICREIVERHGGRIWAESAVGQGMKIHFTLPVWKDRG